MQLQIISLILVCQSFFCCISKKDEPQVTSTNKVFKSIDGGKTWDDISDGFPNDTYLGDVMVVSDKVVAATDHGVYYLKDNNGAQRWQKDMFLNDPVYNINYHNGNLQVISPDRGVMQKVERAGIWQKVYTELTSKNLISSVMSTAEGTVYASGKEGVFKSDDEGQTWSHVYKGTWVKNVVQMGNILVASDAETLFRSADKGQNWTPVIENDGFVRSISSVNNALVAITNGLQEKKVDNTLLQSKPDVFNNVWTSTDEGKTWFKMHQELSGVHQISDYQAFGNTILFGHDGKIFLSTDNGNTWQSVLETSAEFNFKMIISGQAIYAYKVNNGC
jgi:photosystem II stability/assembly factor-like uncharacterized protein